MGISTNFYTVYGVKIAWHDAFSEAYCDIYDNCDLSVILDGMGGEYMVLGHVLFDSGDLRWGFENGDDFVKTNPQDLTKLEETYREKFAEIFPQFQHLLEQPFSILSFRHTS